MPDTPTNREAAYRAEHHRNECADLIDALTAAVPDVDTLAAALEACYASNAGKWDSATWEQSAREIVAAYRAILRGEQ